MPAKMRAGALTGERALPAGTSAEAHGPRAGDWIGAQRPQGEMRVAAGEMSHAEPTGGRTRQAAALIAALMQRAAVLTGERIV